MPRPPCRRPPGALTATLLTGLLGLWLGVAPAAAGEDAVARPVPASDSYRAYASGSYTFAVLDNDDVSVLSDGELTLCGVSVDDATAQVLYAEIDRVDPSLVYVEVSPEAEGAYAFTYEACQDGERRAATVRVDVASLQAPTVVAGRRPARIRATNPNDVSLTIQWGSNRTAVIDGTRGLRADRATRIRVERTRVYWVAYLRDQGSVIVAGEGTVHRIKLERRRR